MALKHRFSKELGGSMHSDDVHNVKLRFEPRKRFLVSLKPLSPTLVADLLLTAAAHLYHNATDQVVYVVIGVFASLGNLSYQLLFSSRFILWCPRLPLV